MSAPRSPYDASAERSSSLHYRRMLLGVWTVRAEQAQRIARHPPLLRDWLCIHRYEAAWNDPDAPYYGGLQMDLSFQRAYGAALLRRKGTADHWTPLEQIWVAERAYRSGLGFYPWPTTWTIQRRSRSRSSSMKSTRCHCPSWISPFRIGTDSPAPPSSMAMQCE